MPLLIVDKSDLHNDLDLPMLVGHLARRWPGSHLLATGPEVPATLPRAGSLDWVGVPHGFGDDGHVRSALLSTVVRRFEVQAGIGLGVGAADVLASLDLPLRLVLVQGPGSPAKLPANVEALGSGSVDELLASLDTRLSRTVAVELVTGPQRHWPQVEAELAGHAAAGRMGGLLIRWQGPVGPELDELVRRVRSMPETAGAVVELQLLSSELFDVPRAGLTHTPGEFLFNPRAWIQAMGFARLLLWGEGRVRIRVRTHSRREWIRRTVEAANQSSGWIHLARRRLGGGGR